LHGCYDPNINDSYLLLVPSFHV